MALILLHDSRRDACLDERGDLVLLEDQDRRRWDQQQITEALPLVEEALRGGTGSFALQAAITPPSIAKQHGQKTLIGHKLFDSMSCWNAYSLHRLCS